MRAENLQKGVLYKDIVGQRADPDLTSTWPTLARPHGSEEVRVWGQASSGKGRPRQVRGQRKHAVTWPDPTFEDTIHVTKLIALPKLRAAFSLQKIIIPMSEFHLANKLVLLARVCCFAIATFASVGKWQISGSERQISAGITWVLPNMVVYIIKIYQINPL